MPSVGKALAHLQLHIQVATLIGMLTQLQIEDAHITFCYSVYELWMDFMHSASTRSQTTNHILQVVEALTSVKQNGHLVRCLLVK